MDKNYKPYYNIGPGPFIKEELEARNWRQEDLAAIIGMSLKSVNQFIKNKQAITVETAQLLNKAFGQSAQFWLNLDANYRLRLKEDVKRTYRVGILAEIFNYMPIKEMIKKGWLRKYRNPEGLAEQVKSFWGMQALEFKWFDGIAMPNLRKSSAYKQFNLYYAYTWFTMAKKLAVKYPVVKYREDMLNGIADEFAEYTKKGNIKEFLNLSNAAGVKFFVLNHLAKTYLDGAAFRDNGNPVIVYTLRYDRVDNFWFTIAHEIAHILLHIRRRGDYFIDNLTDAITTIKEHQANAFALKMIRAEDIKYYFKGINTYISEWRVNDCAEQVGVSPALVVGVLQHEGKLSPRNLNRFKETVSDKIPKQYWAEERLGELQ